MGDPSSWMVNGFGRMKTIENGLILGLPPFYETFKCNGRTCGMSRGSHGECHGIGLERIKVEPRWWLWILKIHCSYLCGHIRCKISLKHFDSYTNI